MASTYNNIYLDARKRLRDAGIESAQLEARELVCHAAGKSREQFLQGLALYAPGQVEEQVRQLVLRRLAGEPVAYLIGEWEFYGLTVAVSPAVLIPRMDTELLAERGILLARAAGEGARVLDLCAGSGCVGLAVAANVPGCQVVLAEVDEQAIELCKENIRRNDLEDRVHCALADVRLRPGPSLRDFDVIVCNPPYIPKGDIETLEPCVKDYEPRIALDGGADGLDYYRIIPGKWGCALRPGGSLLFEVGFDQAQDVEALMVQAGFTQLRSWQDTQGIWRVVEGILTGQTA